MSKLFVQVERVEDLIGRADNYFGCDLCGKDSVDAKAFAYAEKKKPITNADRIRAMTDEELANFIAGQRGWYCDFKDPSEEEYPKVLLWLTSPVEMIEKCGYERGEDD